MPDPRHDDQCDRHSRELVSLTERLGANDKDLDAFEKRIQLLVDQYNEVKVILGRMDERAKHIEADVGEIKETLREKVTPKEDYLTLRNQVWGAVGAVFLMFIASLFYIVTHPGTSAAAGLVTGGGK